MPPEYQAPMRHPNWNLGEKDGPNSVTYDKWVIFFVKIHLKHYPCRNVIDSTGSFVFRRDSIPSGGVHFPDDWYRCWKSQENQEGVTKNELQVGR